MPSQPDKLKTYTGTYNSIRLDFTPEPLEPRERWSKVRANYPVELAWLRIYLDGNDALPIERVPSAYCFALFAGLLKALPQVRAGQSASAHWRSDPWRIDLYGHPERDAIILTVQFPDRIAPLNQVEVPLSGFGNEVIRVSRRWLEYINDVYHEEIIHPRLGEEYRRFEQQVLEAERAVR